MKTFIFLIVSKLLLISFIGADEKGCECGTRGVISSRIIGGDAAETGEFPWRVSLLLAHKNSTRGTVCGGTIISPNFVLTAAHCVDKISNTTTKPSDYMMWIGSGSTKQLDSKNGQLRLVYGDDIIIHENWNRTKLIHDIALIYVQYGFNFSYPNTCPICLPFKYADTMLRSEQLAASGWGQTNNTGNSASRYLRKAQLNLLEYDDCNQKLKELHVSNRVDELKICTSTPGKDICQGDSGGSVDYFDGEKVYAYGINSFVMGKCANPRGASVMTKVSQYLDWILRVTGTHYYFKP